MPELPEVESTLRLLKPVVVGKKVQRFVLHRADLRYPINLNSDHFPLYIQSISRRAKYLIFHTTKGVMIAHLGMTGYFHWGKEKAPRKKHDHIEWLMSDSWLRFNDARRFGFIRWYDSLDECTFLQKLGPEPLEDAWNVDYLRACSRSRRIPIKAWIMDQRCVVGVGNIYAAEALFSSRIHPNTPSCAVKEQQLSRLVSATKAILISAIESGGSTIRDYQGPDQKPGYFSQKLNVYGREGLPCIVCQTPLKNIKIAQRQSVFCEQCQPMHIKKR